MARSISLIDLHHVSRTTCRLDESIDFYCQVLGFVPLTRPPFSLRGAWLYAAGIQLHLIETPVISPHHESIDSRRDHIAFRVADVTQVVEVLRERGIPFLERTNAGGIRQVFFRDPDGHQIELASTSEARYGYQAE